MPAIEEYRERIEEGIAEALSRVPENLYEPVRHMALGGKRLRPFLVLASCEAVGGKLKKAMKSAVAIELIHTFSLVHDDIMDQSRERRGKQTVHVKFGVPTAILVGDFLGTIGLELLSEEGLFREGSALIKEICEGQKMDIDFESREIGKEEYFKMIELKTADTFRCACEVGAILGGASNDTKGKLGFYGLNFGMAFQIGDDFADTFAEKTSKDLEMGKKTLPVIMGWSREEASVKGEGLMKSYMDRALGSISDLGESRGREVLVSLARRFGSIGGFI